MNRHATSGSRLVTTGCLAFLLACDGESSHSDGQGGAASSVASSSGLSGPVSTATSSGSDGGGGGGAAPASIQGRIAKGPFAHGSLVTVSAFDAAGAPTGQQFTTTTSDDGGSFSSPVGSAVFVEIRATGYQWCEERGAISDGVVTESAWAVVDGATVAHVNVVTQLTHERISTLVASGATFPDAISQAESELATELGLGGGVEPGKPGTQMDLLGGSDTGNAYDYALSLIVSRQVQDGLAGGDSFDGVLQTKLADLTTDFADGHFEPAVLDEIHEVEHEIYPFWYEGVFARRFVDTGVTSETPDLDLVIDTDGDGIPNAADNCPFLSNASQAPVDDPRCNFDFQFIPSATSIGQLGAAELADFDGDGLDDLLWIPVGNNTTLNVQLGTASGRFENATMRVIGGDGVATLKSVADVDGDGRLDLIGTDEDTNGHPVLLVSLQNADGSFATPQNAWAAAGGDNQCPVPTEPGTSFTTHGSVVQTASGLALMGQSGTSCVLLVHATADGTFGPAEVIVEDPAPICDPLPPHGCSCPYPDCAVDRVSPVAGDFDGDGNQDYASLIRDPAVGSIVLELSLADGMGGFTPRMLQVVTAPGISFTEFNAHTLTVGDFDDDGADDLFLVGAEGTSPLRSLGDGTFAPLSSFDGIPYLADIDGDGQVDLIAFTIDREPGAPNYGYHHELYQLDGTSFSDVGALQYSQGEFGAAYAVGIRYRRDGSDCLFGQYSEQGGPNGAGGYASVCFN